MTWIEVAIIVCVLAIIAAIALPNLSRSASKAEPKPYTAVSDDGFLRVREWIDAKTGKRYLIFDRFQGGVFAIEAPVSVEKSK